MWTYCYGTFMVIFHHFGAPASIHCHLEKNRFFKIALLFSIEEQHMGLEQHDGE